MALRISCTVFHSSPISIALEREGELVAGLIYNPASGDIYTAERGKGAFLNDNRRLRVASRGLDNAVIVMGVPHRGKPGHERHLRELAAVMRDCSGIRRTGSAALDLAWVAQGRFDALLGARYPPWDMAAGIVLVREAGGLVSDPDGRQNMLKAGAIVCGNEAIHDALLKRVAAANS